MGKIKLSTLIFITFIFFNVFFSCSEEDVNLGYVSYKEPDTNKIIPTKKWGFIPINQICIMLKNNFGKSEAEKIATSVNGKIVGEIEFLNLFQIENDNSTEEELTEQLEKLSNTVEVEYAFPNAEVCIFGGENVECNPLEDSIYKGDNGKAYEMIGLKNAWDIIKISKVKLNPIKVGVNDTRLGTKSNEIMGEAGIGGDEESDLNNKTGNSHANSVVNIIGANSKNGGVSGVASILGKNLNINVVGFIEYPKLQDTSEITRVTKDNGYSYHMTAAAELIRQIKSGAKVINCSFGNQYEDKNFSLAMKSFLEKIYKKYPDVLFVAAAGNFSKELKIGLTFDYWSHNLPNLIVVGALDQEGKQSNYTNFGTGNGEITLSACGSIVSEYNELQKGTSYAAPQVSGVAAIMKSINPKLTAEEIKKILIETASKTVNGIEVPSKLGAGCLRADEAVLRVINNLRIEEGKDPLKMEDLIGLANLEVTSSGGPEEFLVTATINKTSPEGGTSLEIDISGGNYSMSEEKIKTINSPGSVGWTIKKPDLESILRVKVKRLDTDNCRVILLKSQINPKDLVGQWEGEVVAVGWSSSSELISKYTAPTIESVIGIPKPLTINVEYVDEKNLLIALKVEGGKAIPKQNFSFINNKLHSVFFFGMHTYTYDAIVKEENDKYTIDGKWTTVTYNNTVTMNGTWKCLKKK